MALYSNLVLAVFYLAVLSVNALPMVKKDEAANKKKDDAKSTLEAQLGKLKQDGVAVQKTEHIVSETVNGKMENRKTEKETVTDAKTGEVVATASKTVTKNDQGERNDQARIDVPAAAVHQAFNGAEAESFELLPADDVARYIFDTSDIDGVKTAVQTLVDTQKISKKAAENYVQEIREHLNALHEEALKEMTAELEERRKDEDAIYKDMLSMAQVLNNNADTEKALYSYAKKLYAAYRVEGDEYARDTLNEFTNVLQQEAESGNLDESVQDNIYDIVLKALKDVSEETRSNASGEMDNVVAADADSTAIDASASNEVGNNEQAKD